jgi:hypothetical protein
MSENASPEVAELESLGWELTHSDPGGVVDQQQFAVGRTVLSQPSFSARKITVSGSPTDLTFASLEQLLESVKAWEAHQRP